MKLKPNRHQFAIDCHSEHGTTFGDIDIFISSNSNTNKYSLSDLGDVYKHPQYAFGTNEARSFLAGSYKFQLS